MHNKHCSNHNNNDNDNNKKKCIWWRTNSRHKSEKIDNTLQIAEEWMYLLFLFISFDSGLLSSLRVFFPFYSMLYFVFRSKYISCFGGLIFSLCFEFCMIALTDLSEWHRRLYAMIVFVRACVYMYVCFVCLVVSVFVLFAFAFCMCWRMNFCLDFNQLAQSASTTIFCEW